MRKVIIYSIISIFFLIPLVQTNNIIVAGSGDAAAGVAAGLIGGAMISGAASSSGRRRARRAEEEAREAKREAEAVRREHQQSQIYDIKMQHSSRTFNMLIFAILLLLIGLISLAVIVLKRK